MSTCSTDDRSTGVIQLYRDEYTGDVPIEARAETLRGELDAPVTIADTRPDIRPKYRTDGDGPMLAHWPEDADPYEGDPPPPNVDHLPIETAPLLDAVTDVLPFDFDADESANSFRLTGTGERIKVMLLAEHGVNVYEARYTADWCAGAWITQPGPGADTSILDIDDAPDGDLVSPDHTRETLARLAQRLRRRLLDYIRELTQSLGFDAHTLT